jgi:transcriptional regulator with XRE-family HTH domain
MPPNPAERKKLTLNHEPDAVIWAREKSGLTRKAASDAIGISPQLYSDIEKGRRNATPATLRKMAEVFNCPIVMLERKRWVA